MIPFSQSPKVALAWFLCNASPLQKMNFKLSGWVLRRIGFVQVLRPMIVDRLFVSVVRILVDN